MIFYLALAFNVPQFLRVWLQESQNAQGIQQADEAVISIVHSYFESHPPAKLPKLPTLYDAENGPCEVISSFLEPSS